MAARPQDPTQFVQCVVRVDQMLDDLAEQHRVRAPVGERQAAVEFAAHHVPEVRAGAAQRVVRPVDADEPVAAEERRRSPRRAAVAASHVDDELPRRRAEGLGQQPCLASAAGVARGDRDGRILVEVPQGR